MIKVSIRYPYRGNGHFGRKCGTSSALRGRPGRRRYQRGAAGHAAARHFMLDATGTLWPHAQTLLDNIPNYMSSGNGTVLIGEIKVPV